MCRRWVAADDDGRRFQMVRGELSVQGGFDGSICRGGDQVDG